MNARILELAIQAGLHPALLLCEWGTVEALTDTEQEELANIERFARLIVAECAAISDSIGEHGHIANAEMMEHFGIE